jgi:hypothetical protein
MAETREETVVKEMVALDTNLPMVIMEMARERVIERVGSGELRRGEQDGTRGRDARDQMR